MYCKYCGIQTENDQLICDNCLLKQANSLINQKPVVKANQTDLQLHIDTELQDHQEAQFTVQKDEPKKTRKKRFPGWLKLLLTGLLCLFLGFTASNLLRSALKDDIVGHYIYRWGVHAVEAVFLNDGRFRLLDVDHQYFMEGRYEYYNEDIHDYGDWDDRNLPVNDKKMILHSSTGQDYYVSFNVTISPELRKMLRIYWPADDAGKAYMFSCPDEYGGTANSLEMFLKPEDCKPFPAADKAASQGR